MSTQINHVRWPPWVKVTYNTLYGDATFKVTVGASDFSFTVPLKDASTFETQTIVRQLYLTLKDKQARLDAVTARITKR
jgi:hypothetical protein